MRFRGKVLSAWELGEAFSHSFSSQLRPVPKWAAVACAAEAAKGTRHARKLVGQFVKERIRRLGCVYFYCNLGCQENRDLEFPPFAKGAKGGAASASFATPWLDHFPLLTQGLRPGLHSCAAPRLGLSCFRFQAREARTARRYVCEHARGFRPGAGRRTQDHRDVSRGHGGDSAV